MDREPFVARALSRGFVFAKIGSFLNVSVWGSGGSSPPVCDCVTVFPFWGWFLRGSESGSVKGGRIEKKKTPSKSARTGADVVLEAYAIRDAPRIVVKISYGETSAAPI